MVEAVLKAKDADVTRGFEDHRQFRDQWEPFSKIDGLKDVDPQEVDALIQFRNVLTDPEKFSQWLSSAVASTGWADEQTWAQVGQANGWLDGTEPTGGSPNGEEGEVPPWAQQLAQEVSQMREQFGGRFEEQDTREQQGQIRQGFESRLNELTQQHAQSLPPDDEESGQEREAILGDILTRAMGLIAMTPDDQDPPEDPIGDAFNAYLRVKGGAEGDALEARLQRQSGGQTLTGGRAPANAEQLSWNGNGQDPKEAALARMRAAR